MSLLNCIAIDDEPRALEVIKTHCHKIPFLNLKAVFRDSLDAFSFLKENETDLIFLDINMPRVTGMQFLDLLKHRPMIIFTTAYSEYAIDSYEYEAVDYLLKPIAFDRFLKAATKAIQRAEMQPAGTKPVTTSQSQENQFLYLKSGPKLHKLSYDDILFVEKDGNYLQFHTPDQKILSRQNMKNVFQILPDKQFVRVHRSFVINLNHLRTIENHQVTIGETPIPLSSQYREDLMTKLDK